MNDAVRHSRPLESSETSESFVCAFVRTIPSLPEPRSSYIDTELRRRYRSFQCRRFTVKRPTMDGTMMDR